MFLLWSPGSLFEVVWSLWYVFRDFSRPVFGGCEIQLISRLDNACKCRGSQGQEKKSVRNNNKNSVSNLVFDVVLVVVRKTWQRCRVYRSKLATTINLFKLSHTHQTCCKYMLLFIYKTFPLGVGRENDKSEKKKANWKVNPPIEPRAQQKNNQSYEHFIGYVLQPLSPPPLNLNNDLWRFLDKFAFSEIGETGQSALINNPCTMLFVDLTLNLTSTTSETVSTYGRFHFPILFLVRDKRLDSVLPLGLAGPWFTDLACW